MRAWLAMPWASSQITSAGLDDYISTVVANYLVDRGAGESFAGWTQRADEVLLRGEKAL